MRSLLLILITSHCAWAQVGSDTLPKPRPVGSPKALIREEDSLGGPALILAGEVKINVGEFGFVKANTTGKIVRWKAVDAGLSVIPSELLRDTKTAVVIANKPGRYRLHAVTAEGDIPSAIMEVVIVVGDVPAPGPDPKPPEPVPDDPLTSKLKKAFDSDRSLVDSAKHLATLAGFYEAMANHTKGTSAKTVGELLADYRVAIPTVLPEGSIPALRRACGEEIALLVGDDSEALLDPTLRPKLVDLFTRIQTSLKKIK